MLEKPKETNVILAGFGGQGILLAGKLLAYGAMEDHLEVSWLPSYGPEMRGGTANVTVCISKQMIGSPLVTNPKGLIAMNLPSLQKFAPKVEQNGLIIINASLIGQDPKRKDCKVIRLDAINLAREAGTEKAATMVLLGAWLGATEMVSEKAMIRVLKHFFSDERAAWLDANLAAFETGYTIGHHAMAPALV